MKTIIYITIFFIATILTSCDDYLEVRPKGKIIPETVEDYKLMFNDGDYVKLINGELFHGDDSFLASDAYVDGSSNLVKQSYLWAKEIYDETSVMYSSWNMLYANVFQSNLIIDGVEGALGDELEKKQVVAAAKAKRALQYFFLINLYAKHYDESSASTDLGVYLIDNPDLNQKISHRATVKEIYDFILSDLEYAIANLPNDITPSKVMFYNSAALALRSRVYLTMQKYAEAKKDADVVLGMNNSLLNYNDLEIVVMSYPGYGSWMESNAPEAPDNDEVYATAYYSSVYWTPDLPCANSLVNLYDDNDIRKKQYILQLDGTYHFSSIVQISLAPTVPELLLIRAECNARNGGNALGEALDDINYLRRNRYEGGEDLQLADFNQTQLLDLVLLERRKELCMKGHRWFDLKRLNLSKDTEVTLNRSYKGEVRTLLPNGNNYVFPIPYSVMYYNPEIQNNPRD